MIPLSGSSAVFVTPYHCRESREKQLSISLDAKKCMARHQDIYVESLPNRNSFGPQDIVLNGLFSLTECDPVLDSKNHRDDEQEDSTTFVASSTSITVEHLTAQYFVGEEGSVESSEEFVTFVLRRSRLRRRQMQNTGTLPKLRRIKSLPPV